MLDIHRWPLRVAKRDRIHPGDSGLKENDVIILGFLAATLILAIAAVRFGVDSRIEAWRNDLGHQWDPAA